jgi:hypothetical protein
MPACATRWRVLSPPLRGRTQRAPVSLVRRPRPARIGPGRRHSNGLDCYLVGYLSHDVSDPFDHTSTYMTDFAGLGGGRSRTRTCDPLIKRLLDLEIGQAVSCKMAQISSFEINGF